MATIQVTIVNPIMLSGSRVETGATPTIDSVEAAALVWRGDATYVTPPTPPVDVSDSVYINSTQIADASTQGKAILVATTLDAFLTAIGASLGAAGSGGTGLKAICVPNADT